MTNDDNINISRRKILGSLGAVGVGAAGAGLGTTAYLNDEESFENNTIAAGQLDLQVGWEEHYYGGLRNLNCDAAVRVLGEDETPGDDEVGFPQRGPSVVAVDAADVSAFMNCTATDSVSTEHTSGPPNGVIDLDDVKPGDFGEVTLCYSIYDNPGYVRLTSSELADDENTVTEPEAGDDPNNDTPTDDDIDGEGELGESLHGVVWYDPGGNNLDDEDTTLLGPAPLNELVGQSAVLDPQEAGGTPAWEASSDEQCHTPGVNCTETLYLSDTGGSNTDSDFEDRTKLFEVTLDDGTEVAELTEMIDLGDHVDGGNFTQVDAIAATPDGESIYLVDKVSAHLGRYDVAADDFTDEGAISGIDGSDGVVLATFSPGGTLYVAGQSSDRLYAIDETSAAVTTSVGISGVDVHGADIVYGSDGTLYLYSSSDGKLYTVDPTSGDATLVGTSQDNKGSFTGLAIQDSGTGELVGSSESDNAVVVLDKADGSAGTEYTMQLSGTDEEYAYGYGDMTLGAICPEYCLAFAWWLPRDVENEVQSDSYTFDITLQTQQCRNNDVPFTNV